MKTWRTWLPLALSVVALCLQAKAQSLSAEEFNMMIQNTSSSISLVWGKPNERFTDMCYRTHIQYRRHCETSWKNVTNVPGFSFQLPAPDMKDNYVFRLRMRLYCINGDWGEWSPEKYWKNDRDPCIAKTTVSIRNYLLVTVLPMAGFLLCFALTQERVRRLILPIIPDPKHTQESILNIEPFQWWGSFSQACEECRTTEILVICEHVQEDTEIPACGAEEPTPQTQPPHAATEAHVHDLNANVIEVHAQVLPECTVALGCSHTLSGYIVL
ncbi:cytokine receptor-like factor 2 [Brachyhypopomus gauderio]|uniref:cytokine receptor-like factor 2 n=1 Tax=Brachyhypopomus gauderio TaxID=698409 RepID=UPI0040415623